jgi:hypothetical protein
MARTNDEYEWLFLEDVVPAAVRKLVSSPSSLVFCVTVAAVLAGTVAIVLAILGRSAVNWLTISATLSVPAQDGHGFVPLTAAAKHVYGYFGELNHGVFFLLVAPAFICLSLLFCRSVGVLINDMSESGQLKEASAGYLAEKVRRRNSWTRWVFWDAMAIFVALNTGEELASRGGLGDTLEVSPKFSQIDIIKPSREDEKRKRRRWNAIGYVQTDYLRRWRDFFDGVHSVYSAPPLGRAYELEGSVFGEAIRIDLGRQLSALSKATSINLRSLLFERIVKVDEAQNFIITPEGLRQLERSALVNFRAETHGGFKTYSDARSRVHWIFLGYVFLLEGCFHGFVLWVLVKVIVFMVVLRDLIPDQGDPQVGVYPFLYDPERRYGLDQLFRCYNQIAVLIALGASFLILISMNTIEVQSAHQPFRFMSMLNMLGFIVVVMALLILVAGPFLFASSALRRRQAREISELHGQLQAARDVPNLEKAEREEKLGKLRERLRIVKSQTTWPRTDATFLSILGFCLVALAFPFPTLDQLAGKQGEEWITLAKSVQKAFHALISPE